MRTSLIASALLLAFTLLPASSRAADTSGSSDSVVLEIDGTPCGRATSWKAPVVDVEVGKAKVGAGRPDKMEFTSASIDATLHLPPVIPAALLAAYLHPEVTHTITLLRVDASGHEAARYELVQPIINAIDLPGMDADHPALETMVRIMAVQARVSKGSGAAVTTPHASAVARARVTLGTLDFSHMTAVGALPLEDKMTVDQLGELREPSFEPTPPTAGPLEVSFDPRHASDLDAWIAPMFGSTPPTPVEGRIDYLDASGTAVASLKLHDVLVQQISQASTGPSVKLAISSVDLTSSPSGGSVVAPSGRVFGTSYPTDAGTITVDSAEYSVGRFPVANDEPVTPAAEEKLLIARLRLKNGGADTLTISPDSLVAHVVDAAGNKTDSTGDLFDPSGAPQSDRQLSPGAEATLVMVTKMAATPAAKSLEIRGVSDADLGLLFDLTNAKNAPKKLVAPFVAANDAAGASALAVVDARPSVAYPMGDFDVTFAGMKKLAKCEDSDRGCWLATFQVVNRSLKTETFDSSSLDLRLSDGAEVLQPSGLYPASGSGDRVAADIVAGGHVTVSAPFPMTITPKELRVRVPAARDFVFRNPTAGS